MVVLSASRMGFIRRNITAVWTLLAVMYQLCLAHPISEEGPPATLTRSEVLSQFKLGTRVVRGPDWQYGSQDGSPPGEGRIDTELNENGYVYVQWDVGHRNIYRMGKDGKYDLQLVGAVSIDDGSVRLVDSDDTLSGQVEIYHDGIWGTVCDVNWDIQDAMVVCRQLGRFLEAVEIKTGSFYGESDRPIVMDRVACRGTESRLTDCPFVCTSSHPCETSQVAGVICRPKLNTIRLVGDGPNPASGRVEIYRNATWGTVCDNDWDMEDVQVICRQLGFSRAQEAKTGAHFGRGEGPVHMEGVACDGSESQLADCPSHCWEEPACSHAQDAGAICQDEE